MVRQYARTHGPSHTPPTISRSLIINHKLTAFVLFIFHWPRFYMFALLINFIRRSFTDYRSWQKLAKYVTVLFYWFGQYFTDEFFQSSIILWWDEFHITLLSPTRVLDDVCVGVVIGHHVRTAPLQLLTAKLLTVLLLMLLLLLHSLHLVILTAAHLHDGLSVE